MTEIAFEILVSPLLEVVFGKLATFIQNKISLVSDVKKNMEKLSTTLSTINCVLADAEEKQFNNLAIRKWLRELKDAAYDAEDVLEECVFEGLQSASDKKGKSIIKNIVKSAKQVPLCHDMGKRIKELRERFDEIAADMSKFNFQERIVTKTLESGLDRETSSTLPGDTPIYGREEVKQSLVKLLLGNVNRPEKLSVCPIVGIGGLGKTTLAQMVYNNVRVQHHFKVRSWVYVSDDFDVKRLINAIIVSLSGFSCDLQDLHPLQIRLQEVLRGKRFLVVLDDVWSDDQDAWDKLKTSLECGAEGSSVVVTTRLQTVARITGTVPAYRPQLLSEDDCWSLFKHRAFGSGKEVPSSLGKIGIEIVKKCGGVPLAAKALGGLMRFKCKESEWLFVKDSELWDLPATEKTNILPALRLSYSHLPSHMKQCFSFCSVFPKDCPIQKRELILLWMANGLVQPQGQMEMEDVGDQIFKALVLRSLFQGTLKDGYVTYTMHDLVHDLACHTAQGECLAIEMVDQKAISRSGARHLSYSQILSSSMLESILKSSPCLRSLINRTLFSGGVIENSGFLSSFVRLRALEMNGRSVEVVPTSIGKLKHIRYLDFSQSNITSLPESICGLTNLQTLRLTGCDWLEMLPENLGKLCNLRHLEIQGCLRLTRMPPEIGQLTRLQTLTVFIVSLDNGCGIKNLEGLNLNGQLEIKGLENVKSSAESRDANLLWKKNLRSLELSWSDYHLQDNIDEVLEGLQPHSSLRRLTITGYVGVGFPNWLGLLPNLVDMSLWNCRKLVSLPEELRELSSLKALKIWNCPCLKYLPELEMVSLEKLAIYYCESLTTPCCGLRHLSALQELKIKYCPKFTCFPEGLKYSTMLQSISIWHSDYDLMELPDWIGNLTSLQTLSLRCCKNLKKLPMQHLTALQTLKIWGCQEFEGSTQDFHNLISLGSLTLSYLPKLTCFPEEMHRLTALEDLAICGCQAFEASTQGFHNLVALRSLSLVELPKLTCFPEGIKHATMLESLRIQESDIMELPDWIRNLTSLKTLILDDCKNLKILPEAMRKLTALQQLTLSRCSPELNERCMWYSGQDRYKISHIPNIVVSKCFCGMTVLEERM